MREGMGTRVGIRGCQRGAEGERRGGREGMEQWCLVGDCRRGVRRRLLFSSMAPNLQLSLGNINTEKTNESSSGKETATTTKDKITGGSISKTSNPFAYSPKPTYKAVENYVSNPSTHNEEDDISNSLNKCNVKRRLNFNMGANTEGPTQSSFPKENPPDVHAAKAEEQRLSIPVYPHRMTRIDRFVKIVVCEFYTNLVPELVQQGKVILRGKFYYFNPTVINSLFDSPNINDDYQEDLDIVAYELTGGIKHLWTTKDTVQSAILTPTYALLHKVALHNWMPTKHKSYFKASLAVFLHKITNGVKINLGKLLFDQVLNARDGKQRRKELILPNMVFNLLVMQGFQVNKDDCFETEAIPIKVDSRLLVHDHAEDIGVTKFTTSFPMSHRIISFLHEELKWIADQQEMLQAREKIINAFLSSLLWDSAAPAGPSHHHADSSASNPGYTPLAPGDTTKSRVA
nr:uncharacterized protein LOC109169177 [Ipomoea batatas]